MRPERIAVSEGAITAGVDAVLEARDALDGVVRTALADASASATGWKGSSGSAARSLAEDWGQEMSGVTKQLDALRVQLIATEKDQVAAEEGQNVTISGLARMMGALG